MRNKLFLAFVMIAMVAILAIILFVRLDNPRQIRAYMVGGGMAGVEDLVTELEDFYDTYENWNNVEIFLKSLQENPMGGHRGMMSQRIRLADPSGRVIFDSSGNLLPSILLDEEEKQAIILHEVSGKKIGYLLPEGGVNFNENASTALIKRLNDAAIRAGLIAILIALILASLLSWQITKPILQLTLAAQSLSKGDLTKRVTVDGEDELGVLAKSFNKMSDSLQISEKRRKAMTSDIAHELRTPLAVQKAQLEALQDGITKPTKKNLASLLEQNSHLTRLVEDLRILALADAGELRFSIVPFNLTSLIDKIVDKFSASLVDNQNSIVVNPKKNPRLKINADPDRVEQILTNLISNARNFSPKGGTITISLATSDVQAIVRIQDEGPGIPEDSVSKVFDRFYRVETSRSRDKGGSGLGLAIARQLAIAQGGNIQAANLEKGGSEFTLTLPLVGK
jgi:two-component system sensor histidine kinase BaeS